MNKENMIQILSTAGCNLSNANKWAEAIANVLDQYAINSPKRLSAFLANVMVESNYLRSLTENLNYSAQGLANTWRRFSSTGYLKGKPNDLAINIARNPEKIANYTYANRMGNGDVESGDGFRYRGRGLLQITGKNNYEKFFKWCNKEFIPEKVSEGELAVLAAVWYWDVNNLNRYADNGDFDGCCDIINLGRKTRSIGDAHGYNTRVKIYNDLLSLLHVHPRLLDKGRQLVVDARTMEKVIPDDIHQELLDPNSEFITDTVSEFETI